VSVKTKINTKTVVKKNTKTGFSSYNTHTTCNIPDIFERVHESLKSRRIYTEGYIPKGAS